MTSAIPDYDNPEIEEAWCNERRAEVTAYLKAQQVAHGQVGEWPAWHVAPHVSVWAIESAIEPGSMGLWVISGDLPTDFASSRDLPDPREAVRMFAERWRAAAVLMARGKAHPEVRIGGNAEERKTLAPLLRSRAELLSRWAEEAMPDSGHESRAWVRVPRPVRDTGARNPGPAVFHALWCARAPGNAAATVRPCDGAELQRRDVRASRVPATPAGLSQRVPSMPNLAKKSISALVAAATVAGTLAASSTGTQARGFYAPVGAGMLGALALGAMAAEASAPRYARVVEHRYAPKKNGKLHYCGCLVRDVRVY